MGVRNEKFELLQNKDHPNAWILESLEKTIHEKNVIPRTTKSIPVYNALDDRKNFMWTCNMRVEN